MHKSETIGVLHMLTNVFVITKDDLLSLIYTTNNYPTIYIAKYRFGNLFYLPLKNFNKLSWEKSKNFGRPLTTNERSSIFGTTTPPEGLESFIFIHEEQYFTISSILGLTTSDIVKLLDPHIDARIFVDLETNNENLQRQIKEYFINALASIKSSQQKQPQQLSCPNLEEQEFQQLKIEIQKLNPTNTKQISDYITRNKLGYKYRHISGHLEMQQGEKNWIYPGAISPRWYARLCQDLHLDNQHSGAVPLNFKSFKEILP